MTYIVPIWLTIIIIVILVFSFVAMEPPKLMYFKETCSKSTVNQQQLLGTCATINSNICAVTDSQKVQQHG